jgi:hypothetical protein
MTFADGACEGRSRNEEEAMLGTSTTTRDAEIVRNLDAVVLATNAAVFIE